MLLLHAESHHSFRFGILPLGAYRLKIIMAGDAHNVVVCNLVHGWTFNLINDDFIGFCVYIILWINHIFNLNCGRV